MAIKVGQIGKGSFGSKILSKLKKIEEVELSWILGSKDKYWEYEADWVIVASPSIFHYEQSKFFLEKGINVFCEKPAAFNYEAVKELYEIASDNNCKFYVDDVLIYEHIEFTKTFSYKKWGSAFSNILDRIAYHHFYCIYYPGMDSKFRLHVLNNKKLEKEFTLKFGKQLYHFNYNFDWYKKKYHNIKATSETDALETMLRKVLTEKADFKANKERSIFATKIVQELKSKLYGKVAVVGAGIYGITSAIKLADKGYDVDVYESKEDILSSTSGINQYRIHKGYHYPRSKETILSCRDNEKSFISYYNRSVLDKVDHYYSIAKRDSLTTPREYLHRLDECNLEWSLADTQQGCELSVKVEENLYCPSTLKKICLDRLNACNVNLILNHKVENEEELSEYQYKVIATYSSLNEFDYKDRAYQFELCEKPIFLLPKGYKNKSIVVMDGPFMCFDPYSDTPYHVAGNVVHAIHSTNIGTEPIIPPAYKDYLNQGVIRNPKYSNASSFIEAAKEFFPDIEYAQHIGSMYTIRTVLPNKDETDERPTIVRFEEDKAILFSGKVVNCVEAADKIALQL